MDGRIPPSALTDDERREMTRLQAAISGSLDHVRHAPPPDVASLVMAKIRAAEVPVTDAIRARRPEKEASWSERAVAWLWTPRTVRLRPAWGMAGIAMMALGLSVVSSEMPGLASPAEVMAGGGSDEVQMAEQTARTGSDAVLYVRFQLSATSASSVSLAGTFTDWQPSVELAQLTPGHWTALVPLNPGVHDYAFVIDGERWVADPNGLAVRDAFGGVNSRIALLHPEA
jgi:hypothetical protein